MTILILNWRDIKHPLSGGAEISLFEHAKYWIKKGANIIWFASSFDGAKPKEIIDGIEIIRQGSHFTVHIHAYYYFFYYLKKRVDIILDNFHFIPFFSPLYASDKTILAFINEPAKEAWFKNINFLAAIIGFMAEPLFFLPYKNIPFLTGSPSIAKELPSYGIVQNHITVVPHGISVDMSVKQKRAAKPTLLYLAQLSPDKGIEDAINMFVILKKSLSSVRLLVAGKSISSQYKDKITHLVKSLGFTKGDVQLLGFVTEKEKYKLLQEAWILVHPSIREGWGLTVIEAANFGTPTVGYRVTGLVDSIQHMKTGILTDRNTPKSLANSVMKLLQEKQLYATLSQHAVIFAKNFSWDKSGKLSWDCLIKAYEKNKK